MDSEIQVTFLCFGQLGLTRGREGLRVGAGGGGSPAGGGGDFQQLCSTGFQQPQ